MYSTAITKYSLVTDLNEVYQLWIYKNLDVVILPYIKY